MKIGILQTGHYTDALLDIGGDIPRYFERMLEKSGFTTATYDVVNLQLPDTPRECDGWIITGSRHGAYENLPFIPVLEKLIRDIYAADVPLVGVCFGHQIIAQALGGKVEKFSDGWSVGPQTYDWNGQQVALHAWHQDQVTERPAEATVFASSDFCANAALVYGKRAFTVQPHPEYGADIMYGLVDYRGVGVVPDDQLATARAALGTTVDNDQIGAQIALFFKERTVA